MALRLFQPKDDWFHLDAWNIFYDQDQKINFKPTDSTVYMNGLSNLFGDYDQIRGG